MDQVMGFYVGAFVYLATQGHATVHLITDLLLK